MEKNYKISILVPVYNTEKFLNKCLDSLIYQTLKDIEIILVNDGSSDLSPVILDNYKNKDSRIKVITLEKNEGLARARYHGIKEASGKYLMFVDSDDYLELNACERAYEAIEKYKVDILHFSTNIIPFGLVDIKEISNKKSFVDAYIKKLNGEEIFNSCYIKRKFGWNVWNKIYKTEVVKNIIPYIPNKRCVMSEDMFIFSMISFYAKSYYGIKDKLYNYRYGSGVSTVNFSFKQFDSFVQNHVALENMISFHEHLNILSGNRKLFIESQKEEFKNVALWHFMYSVPEKDAAYCFDKVSSIFTIEEIIERLLIYNDIYSFSKRVFGSKFLTPKKDKIKNIALFYFKYDGSGVERVMSKIIPMLISMGYNTTLIIEKDSVNSFPLPPSCKKIIISSSDRVDNDGYMKHAKELKKALIDNKIDLLLYQASNSPYMVYDLLIAKSLGLYFSATTHDWITSPLLYHGKHFSWKPQVLRLVDLVQTITKVEETVYRQYRINATYIPNPLTFKIPKEIGNKENKKELLWVGRIDHLQKNPIDMIYILLEVKRFIPDIHLTMIGSCINKKESKDFTKFISNQNLSKNITWIPHTNKIEEYYKKADVMIMTSSYEVYPMVVGEALSYGLPIISYEMPYVELFMNNEAIISVEPNNIKLTAQAILDLISDEDKLKKLRSAAHEYIVNVSKEDIPAMWKNELKKLEENKKEVHADKNIEVFLDVTYQHYYNPKSYFSFYNKSMLITNLFRYFKKFGIRITIKKIYIYIKKYGLKAAMKKGEIRI